MTRWTSAAFEKNGREKSQLSSTSSHKPGDLFSQKGKSVNKTLLPEVRNRNNKM